MTRAEQRVATALAAGRGTDGNERMTGLMAVVLLVLLAVEGVTIVFLEPLLPEHFFVGLVLIPPLAVKLASTGYRFARYYTHDAAYRAKGPPHWILRSTAPLVVLSTAGVFGTGVWLLVSGDDELLWWHKASFVAWFAVTTVHVLGHLPSLPRVLRSEYAPAGAESPAGRPARQLVLVAALLAGVVLAVLLLPDFSNWPDA